MNLNSTISQIRLNPKTALAMYARGVDPGEHVAAITVNGVSNLARLREETAAGILFQVGTSTGFKPKPAAIQEK